MTTQPGWYPDNTQPNTERWHDGTAWTPATRPMPGAAFTPPPAAMPGKKRRRWPWVLAAVVVLIVIISVASNSSSKKDTASSPAAQVPNAVATDTSSAAGSKKPAPAPAPKTLVDVKGNGTKQTATFKAGGDWTLSYSYDCSNFGQQGNFQVMQYRNGELDTIAVNEIGLKGSDATAEHQSGTYYLSVNSECAWHIKAVG